MAFEEAWSGDIPDGYDASDAVAQFKQHVYEHWLRGEGPCHGCPNRTDRRGCKPAIGMGNATSDLMLVGHVPGPGNRDLETENRGRKIDPEKLEELPEFDGHPLFAFYGNHVEEIGNWNGISTMRKRFLEHDQGLGMELGDIYFTNAKKCPDILGKDSRGALSRCGSYLSKQIELVDPDVIVTWGREAAIGTARCLDYDTDNLPGRTMALMEGDVNPTSSFIGYRETDPYLVTMPHWVGFMGSNIGKIPGFDPDEHRRPVRQLYYELADLVGHLMDADVV